MATAYLGLGSNIGDREAAIAEAYRLLEKAGEAVIRRSPLYETEPWGYLEQARFLNAVCEISTDRTPHALLRLLKQIEQDMGRQPSRRNGPRIIDLDILLYDAIEISTEVLSIPHPGMLERSTVLVPLCDIAREARHPRTERSMGEHLSLLEPVTGIAPYPPGLG
ncbi:MAG: 2-amino-4-hydroxy-6-hydroxymethyldihydropteridine diphosphokinase [Chloroflexi bacterium]|nr:2-amino-4-hydroxy-6-hydroxymethyldihydropteridine diphosphokinase [Chloroflexota bacterium]